MPPPTTSLLGNFLQSPGIGLAAGLLTPTRNSQFGPALLQGLQAANLQRRSNLFATQSQQAIQSVRLSAERRKKRDIISQAIRTGRVPLQQGLMALAALSNNPVSAFTSAMGSSPPTQVITRIENGVPMNVLINKDTGEEIKSLGQNAAPLGQREKDIFGQEDKLRDEHRTLSKTFIDVNDSFNRVQVSAKDPSAAGDLSLIFNYMKMLDPASVVRESEFATAANAGGVSDQLRGQYNKVVSGERLSAKQRADFTDRANRLFARQQKTQRSLDKQFVGLAKRNGLNPNNIVFDFGTANRFSSMTPAQLKAINPGRLTEKEKRQLLEVLGG